MKIILSILIIVLGGALGHSQTTLTLTRQSEINAYNFQSGEFYFITISNDTTLPISDQVSDLSPLHPIDTGVYLDLYHTLVTDLTGLENVQYLGLDLEGNINMDTLFLGDEIITLAYLYIENTYLKNVSGLRKVRDMGRVSFSENHYLKTINLELSEMDSTSNGTELTVRLNDSLETFYWGNPHEELKSLSFFDNRQLKHVHIETARELLTYPSSVEGGFVFNPVLDSISGFIGLDTVRAMIIKQNYMLTEACVFQKGIDNFLMDNPNLSHFFEVHSNGAGLGSVNDLLAMDCSWLPNGVNEGQVLPAQIYPNPAHNEVFVKGITQPTLYVIYDMSGKQITQGTVTLSGRIGLEQVVSGMYILKVGNQHSKLLVE